MNWELAETGYLLSVAGVVGVKVAAVEKYARQNNTHETHMNWSRSAACCATHMNGDAQTRCRREHFH